MRPMLWFCMVLANFSITNAPAQESGGSDSDWKLMGKQGEEIWTRTWYIGNAKKLPNSNFTYSLKTLSKTDDDVRYWLNEVALDCMSTKEFSYNAKSFMKDGSVKTLPDEKWMPIIPESKGEKAYDYLCLPEKPLYRDNRWTKIAENVYVDLNTRSRSRDGYLYAAWYKMDYFKNKGGKKALQAYVVIPAKENILINAEIVVERYAGGGVTVHKAKDLDLFNSNEVMPADSDYVVDAAKKYVVREQGRWPSPVKK